MNSTTLSPEAIRKELRRRNVAVPYRKERPGRKLTFIDWVKKHRPRYIWYDHCVKLAHVLQRVANGDLLRLMIFMPPRHGKSEETSRLFSAYYLYRHPERFVGLNSYSADLAFTLSRAARENFVAGGGALSRSASAVSQWETLEGGGMWAAGVGGPITGKGFHLGIVDDPIKNSDEARSETVRESIKEWYRSTFYTREEPGGAIILIMTRWNEDDLAGWQLAEEADEIAEGEDGEPENWHIVNFEAIKEDREPGRFPASCTVEPDWRQTGEALCPERYPLKRLRKLLKKVGSYFWAALFQQRPAPREGALFKAEHFQIVGALPPDCEFVRYWDNAGTDGGGDYTAGALVARSPDGRFFIVDVVRGQWASGPRDSLKLLTAYLDRLKYGHVRIWNEIEGGSAGKDVAAATLKMFAGFSADCEYPTGSKEYRAEPLATQFMIRNVWLVEGEWNKEFIREAVSFPNGKHDDQIDAAGGAFKRVNDDFDAKAFAQALGAGLSARGSGWKAAA